MLDKSLITKKTVDETLGNRKESKHLLPAALAPPGHDRAVAVQLVHLLEERQRQLILIVTLQKRIINNTTWSDNIEQYYYCMCLLCRTPR